MVDIVEADVVEFLDRDSIAAVCQSFDEEEYMDKSERCLMTVVNDLPNSIVDDTVIGRLFRIPTLLSVRDS